MQLPHISPNPFITKTLRPKPVSPKPISLKTISPKNVEVGVTIFSRRSSSSTSQARIRISVFNLNFRPFSVGVRLWRSIRCLRLFETFSGALRKLENSNQKWSYCMFCIKFMQKLSACPYLSSPLYSITDEIRSIVKV